MKDKFKNTEMNKYFKVVGAGDIELGMQGLAFCGNEHGFHIGVSWGQYGYTGGVLPRDQARALATHILESLEETENEYQDLKSKVIF